MEKVSLLREHFCLIVQVIFGFFGANYANLTYEEYVYPPHGEALGWLMVIAGIFPIPAYAIFFLIKRAHGETLLEVRPDTIGISLVP